MDGFEIREKEREDFEMRCSNFGMNERASKA